MEEKVAIPSGVAADLVVPITKQAMEQIVSAVAAVVLTVLAEVLLYMAVMENVEYVL
tara:strand:- start:411 stop:581 length:171 start_codon:yes stop_codon:yes gene_type:complete